MRDGRKPLLDAIAASYPPYLLARRGWNRKNEEVRDQLNLLNATFSGSNKRLRESARDKDDDGSGMITLYATMAQQAEAVAAFIKRESPGLTKLYEPVGKLYATFREAEDAYNAYMESWRDRLPDSDFSGRTLQLLKQEIEKSLR